MTVKTHMQQRHEKKKKKEIQCVCVIIVIRRSFRNNIGIGLKSETAGDETR